MGNAMSQLGIWGNAQPREEFLRTSLDVVSPRIILRWLIVSGVMASESPPLEPTPPQTGPGDQTATPAAETAKRKAEQTNGMHTRTKRNRYISIAWYDMA